MVRVGHVVFRDKSGDVETECRIRFFFDKLPLQPLHGLLDHLHIEIQSDGRDVSRLLFAEQIARSADLEIGRRNPESRTQLGELLDGCQAFLRIVRQPPFIGHEKIGLGLIAAASNTTAQLIQLGQTERVGSIDDDGVGVGHIDA